MQRLRGWREATDECSGIIYACLGTSNSRVRIFLSGIPTGHQIVSLLMAPMPSLPPRVVRRLRSVLTQDGHRLNLVECSDRSYCIEFDYELTGLSFPIEEEQNSV